MLNTCRFFFGFVLVIVVSDREVKKCVCVNAKWIDWYWRSDASGIAEGIFLLCEKKGEGSIKKTNCIEEVKAYFVSVYVNEEIFLVGAPLGAFCFYF